MHYLFWICCGLLAYTYAGYFLLLCLLGPVVRRWRRPHRVDEAIRPFVSLVISLHNEEKLIAQRITNFEELDYPPDQCELLLGDDCSSDKTRAIIRERMTRNPRIRFFPFDTHQGKTAVINTLVPQARGEIIAFTDANTFYAPDSLRQMVRHFADPQIGSVSGRLILKSATGVNTDDGYWKYETLLKRREDDLGVLLGANGGIYTLRQALFHPLKSDVIQIDDFIWPVSVYQHGCRGVYEPAAIANEEAAPYVEAARARIAHALGLRILFQARSHSRQGVAGAVLFCWQQRRITDWLLQMRHRSTKSDVDAESASVGVRQAVVHESQSDHLCATESSS